MAAPLLVQMEADIDREMEQERLAEERMAESGGKLEDEEDAWGSGTRDLSIPEPPKMFYGPQAQVITNDLKSLDEMVSKGDLMRPGPPLFYMLALLPGLFIQWSLYSHSFFSSL